MTHTEILTKAIDKARANGWKWDEYYDGGYPYYMIWQHDFAKALWGEDFTPSGRYELVSTEASGLKVHDFREYGIIAWVRHLQAMVVADDPIEYLGANI